MSYKYINTCTETDQKSVKSDVVLNIKSRFEGLNLRFLLKLEMECNDLRPFSILFQI